MTEIGDVQLSGTYPPFAWPPAKQALNCAAWSTTFLHVVGNRGATTPGWAGRPSLMVAMAGVYKGVQSLATAPPLSSHVADRTEESPRHVEDLLCFHILGNCTSPWTINVANTPESWVHILWLRKDVSLLWVGVRTRQSRERDSA